VAKIVNRVLRRGTGRIAGFMDVSFSATGRVAVVTLVGQVGLAEGTQLHQALLTAAHAESLILVDMGQLTFLDGAVAGTFVAAAARAMAYGRHLLVAQAAGQPLRVLEGLGASYLLTSVREPDRQSLLDLAGRPRPIAVSPSEPTGADT